MPLDAARMTYRPLEYPWMQATWLRQQQIHWLPEEVPMADDVRDWGHNLMPPEKNLLTQIFRFFTQCYDPETELLTEHGWVKFPQLSKRSRVAQVCDDGSVEFIKPSHYHSSHYDGPMHSFRDQKSYVDLLVTPNHKMVYKYHGTWRSDRADKFLPYQGVKTITAGLKTSGRHELTPYDRLRIAFQADGSVPSDVNGVNKGFLTHYFGFTKKRKIDRLRSILNDLSLPWREELRGDYTWFMVDLGERLEKEFAWFTLWDVSDIWGRAFMNELAYWDGTSVEELSSVRYIYSNTNLVAISKVSAIAAISGLKQCCQIDDGLKLRSEAHSPCHKLSWNPEAPPEVDGQAMRRGMGIEPYVGQVYCVTVPSGRLLVRRNGKVAVCGNSDVEVADNYMTRLLEVFKPTEAKMMLTAFANMEGVHITAYAHLLDTIGMPETEFSAFLDYKEMRDKHDYMQGFNVSTPYETAKTVAAFGAFMEGLQLFASFAILMNFPRFNKMKGMGQIVTWSVRDESLHCDSMIRLYHDWVAEHPEIDPKALGEELRAICKEVVRHEDAFVDLAFEMGSVEGLSAQDVKRYLRYVANHRCRQLKVRVPFNGVGENPLPWLDSLLTGHEHANFFEARSTEYSKGALRGGWEDCYTTDV